MIGMLAFEIFDSLCLAILTGFAIRDWRKQVQAAAMPSGYQNCHACGCNVARYTKQDDGRIVCANCD